VASLTSCATTPQPLLPESSIMLVSSPYSGCDSLTQCVDDANLTSRQCCRHLNDGKAESDVSRQLCTSIILGQANHQTETLRQASAQGNTSPLHSARLDKPCRDSGPPLANWPFHVQCTTPWLHRLPIYWCIAALLAAPLRSWQCQPASE
jgi:hypothetical protein